MSDNYVSSADDILWDPTVNTGYNNDIAGIGRDDDSRLDQQKSISQQTDALLIMDKGGSFDNDGDFILWGNDNGAVTTTTSGPHPNYENRLQRTWKASVNGTPGAVTVRLIYSNTGVPRDYGLIVDSDTDFTSGAEQYPASSISGDTLTFQNVSLADGNFFTLGTELKGPGGVSSNLTLWLKADAGVKNASSEISTGSTDEWENSAGNASFTEVTLDAGDPQLASAQINFGPAVYFDGVDDELALNDIQADVLYSTQDNTSFVAMIPKNLANNVDVYLGWSGDAVFGRMTYFERNGNALRANQFDDELDGSTTNVIDLPTIGTVDSRSTGQAFSVNGRVEDTEVANSIDVTNVGDFVLGGIGAVLQAECYIAEVIAYEGALTYSEIQQVESYLALKYGITLTTDNDGDAITFEAPNANGINEGDYVSSAGAVLWDASVNSTYHNDVTGIGRDDQAGLDQRRSLSANTDGMVAVDKEGPFDSDLDFILWGNDNGAMSMDPADKPPNYDRRLERVWKAISSGTPGSVKLQVIFSGHTGIASNYALHVDDDGVFASGTTDYEAVSISGDTINFENVSLPNGSFFTLGEVRQAPGGVASNLELWLRADAGVTATPTITNWQDYSGNGVSTTINGAPVLESNAANFNAAVDMDGMDDQFITNFTLDPSANDYSFSVVLNAAAGANQGVVSQQNGTGNGRALVYINSIEQDYSSFLDGSNNFSTDQITYDEWDLHSQTFDANGASSSLNFYQKGDPDGNFTFNPNSANGNWLFGSHKNNFDYLEAEVPEFFVYSQEWSAPDRSKIESYLAIKYGLTLDNTLGGDAGDYTSSNDVLLWDASADVTYHNDVAGIGKDVRSDLDQRRSMSANSDAIVIMDKGEAFDNDLDFILWGNDNGATTPLTTVDKHPDYENRIPREWKVALNGSPGLVSVQFVYANSGSPYEYGLHVDADGTFASGTTNYMASSVSGDTITFQNVSLSDGDFFTLGILRPAPGGVLNDLQVWFKSDDGAVGTSPVTGWTDRSPIGNDATWNGNAQFNTSAMNYHPAIECDGAGDYARTTNLSIIGDDLPYTQIAAIVCHNTGATNVIFGTDTNGDRELRQIPGGRIRGRHGGTLRSPSDATFTQDIPGIVTVRYGSGGEADITGVDGETKGFGDPAPFTDSGASQVAAQGNGSNAFEGLIGEAIIYNSEKTDAEIVKIETYLAMKYGVTLYTDGSAGAGDYIASDNTIYWDADNQTGYQNQIIGLGRDDLSGLRQHQSQTTDDSLRIYVGTLMSDNASNTNALANDLSFLLVGHNGERLQATGAANPETPAGITSRFDREWKITNTNFSESVTIEFEWEEIGPFDIGDIRFLVDDDGDFSDATVYADGDAGLSITSGSIVVGNISTTHIPMNQTRYVTIGSASADTPLPIELIDFKAAANDNSHHVDLTWSTSSETNNDFFTVEKSIDYDDWIEAIIVPGAGDSDQRIDYQAVDKNPFPGLSYYRLKQTDYDGTFSFSKIVYVTFDDFPEERILFPNPAVDEVWISGISEDLHSIRILSIDGRDLSNIVWIKARQAGSVALDITKLPVGLYSIVLGDKTLKMVKSTE